MAFTTVEPTPGISAAERRVAHRVGPPAVAIRTSHPSLLATAGFVDVEVLDRTADYRRLVARSAEVIRRHVDELTAIDGAADVERRLGYRDGMVVAIDDGLIVRRIYLARRRSSSRSPSSSSRDRVSP